MDYDTCDGCYKGQYEECPDLPYMKPYQILNYLQSFDDREEMIAAIQSLRRIDSGG